MTKSTKTLAEQYFETLRNVHGDDYVDSMLANKPPVAAPAPVAAPFPGHYVAHALGE